MPKWQIHVMPEQTVVCAAIETVAKKMQMIRDIFDTKVTVTNWFRPEIYNEEIKGAKNSSHLYGMACDFQVKGVEANHVREILAPGLAKLNIRMENLPDSNWVHIDIKCDDKTPLEKRYFKP